MSEGSYRCIKNIDQIGIRCFGRYDKIIQQYSFGGDTKCGEGGIGGLSLMVSPNPVQSDLNVELVTTDSDKQLESKTLDKDLHLILINDQREKVHERISRKRMNKISTQHLKAGRYIMIVYYRGKKYAKHIIVNN